jgi:KDO2-lipid IV(A) lauroyltransferase
MNRLLYHVIVYPLSLLPLACLMGFRPMVYLVLRFVMKYRKKIIQSNLQRSFPGDTQAEIKAKTKAFYLHLSAVLLESVKNLSMSRDSLKKRLEFTNPHLLHEALQRGQHVILVGGHYGNWEWLITSLGIHFPQPVYGLGMRLSSSFWQQKLTQRRERNGLKVIHSKNYREHLQNPDNPPFVLLMLADQSPGDSQKSYWMNFLHQPTAVAFGTESLANETDAAVIYFEMKKIGPSRYSLTFELLTNAPKYLKFGELTESYTHKLEAAILRNPALWMWSHKRWKREVPEDLRQLSAAQEQRFNEKYR